ncbi:MAG: SRPBCC family protein [Alphaproteobacteria bacterium]|nr:SRPBCC family protein [Alphaproteobacteria bacterium]
MIRSSLLLLSFLIAPSALADDAAEAAADAGEAAAEVTADAAEEAVKATAPAKGWNVTRSAEIEAAPEFVWAYVANFETWKDWTNWGAHRDPEATWTYGGTAGEVGHSSSWTGPELGEGEMTITQAETNAKVGYDLFFDGRGTSNPGSITLAPTDSGTLVTWSNTGKMGLIGRLFFKKKVEAMIGTDFEVGLKKLEMLAETDAAYAAKVAAAQEAMEAAEAKAVEAEGAATTKAEAAAAKAEEAAAARAEAEAARRSQKKELTEKADALDAEVETLNGEAAEAKGTAEQLRAAANDAKAALEALKSGDARAAAGEAAGAAKEAAAEAADAAAGEAAEAAKEGAGEAAEGAKDKAKGALTK